MRVKLKGCPLGPQSIYNRPGEDKYMLSVYEKGFLEGVIDGEGCISIIKRKTNHPNGRGWWPEVRLSIWSNNKEYLEKIKSIIDGGYIVNIKGKSWSYNLSHYGCKRLFPKIDLIIKEPRRIHAMKIFGLMEGQKSSNLSEGYIKELEVLITSVPKASR